MNTNRMLVALSALALAACSSSVKDAIDGTLQKRIDTMNDCFPPLFDKAEILFGIAESWRLHTTAPIPDPAGLVWAEQADGSVDVTFVVSGVTATMTMRFYSPTGVAQDLDLGGATTLSEAVDAAATQLAQLFGGNEPFIVGDWTLSGGGVSGAGAFTGILGGTANQNELERLSTTTAAPAGGPPPVANGTITITNSQTNQTCSLTFRTVDLETDTVIDQQYPIGTISMTVDGVEVVTATITMNNNVIARIDVSDVPGHFELNLDTGDVDYKP